MKTTKFQLGLLILFGLFLVGGLLTFAIYKGKAGQKVSVPVVIWGTLDGNNMNAYIQKIDGADTNVLYVQKRAETFDNDLIQALALNKGPDAILVSQDQLFKHLDKIVSIPYDSYPKANYANFVQEAEIYERTEGGLAIPFSVDPLVMYWNRDIFNNSAVALPPKTWDQFSSLAQVLTTKDPGGNIDQSTVALGEGTNIQNTKEILSTLMMQAGNPITAYNGQDTRVTLTLSNGEGLNKFSPGESALDFYTQFSNPANQSYTWNKSLVEAKTYFLSNKLGVYFGFASEYDELAEKNPNLNFDVALIPQIKPSTVLQTPLKVTYGKMYGFSLTIAAQNKSNTANTYQAITRLTTPEGLKVWSDFYGLPSVRRDGLSLSSSDSHTSVFATSALWARGWIDPDTNASRRIFQNMVDQITSGQSTPTISLNLAQNLIDGLYNK